MIKSHARGWVLALALLFAVTIPVDPAAAAGGYNPTVEVSPSVVVPTPQDAQGTKVLLGTGAIVTVTVGPNKVLRPGWPVEVMECDAHPTGPQDCDFLTTLTVDWLTKQRVAAKVNGSVTVHFLLWAPLPDKWDKENVIDVSAGQPSALWVGDDPSNWASTGVISAPVAIRTKAAHLPRAGRDRLSSFSLVAIIGGSVLVAVGVLSIGWHRRRLAT